MLLGVSVQTLGDRERSKTVICWPGIVSLALEAIEARFLCEGLLPSPTAQRSEHHLTPVGNAIYAAEFAS